MAAAWRVYAPNWGGVQPDPQPHPVPEAGATSSRK